MVVGQAVLKMHVDFGAKVHERTVVLVCGHYGVLQVREPFRSSLAQSGDDFAPNFFVEGTTFPEGFLQIQTQLYKSLLKNMRELRKKTYHVGEISKTSQHVL